ncbi:MAG: hypothetical protein K2L56_06350, partial [Prevotella sp.]|nr:hypothetical protein [Prevotella sp.]
SFVAVELHVFCCCGVTRLLLLWSYTLFCAKVHNFSELASDVWKKNKRGFYSMAVRVIFRTLMVLFLLCVVSVKRMMV